jgi:hypothetical protein
LSDTLPSPAGFASFMGVRFLVSSLGGGGGGGGREGVECNEINTLRM